ncbi:aminopeptidase [Iocasia frigidifontis]|uniref:Aminopeptidase n=1 Tax=Iocasia fonsfrigidae TaxID=2682810 RepID=A0A8A7KA55_9FIRM|nr:C1 family peptidase [Iocasia fonsfrigidae]QTL98646.1 aminopeptidase [Iocasia fonsfrigidae]
MSSKAINKKNLQKYSQNFNENKMKKIIADAVIKNGFNDVAMNYESITNLHYNFSEEIDVGKVTNQKKSGRCWMFAALNNIRYSISDKLNIENHDFELSQSYTMFWDKLEKSNYFLENIIETRDMDLTSRKVMWLLNNPTNDGGQWDMFAGIIEKYGIVPKYVMPESYSSSNSAVMNKILNLKLRDNAKILRNYYKQGGNLSELRNKKEEMIDEIYSILCYFLGEPPQSFDFEYRNKEDNFFRDENITPLEFYQKYSEIKMNNYVSIINAPTSDKPFHQTYTVEFLGNVIDGQKIHYLNLEIDMLKELSIAQIKNGEPVWFGCDVGQMSERDYGIMDTDLYNYEELLNTAFTLDKGERLQYGESVLTHAMVFTGVNLYNVKANRWKVQNSWGEEPGNKGFFVMSDKWFEEFNYEVVINKKYLSEELMEDYQKEAVLLEPWDPMGSLACI